MYVYISHDGKVRKAHNYFVSALSAPPAHTAHTAAAQSFFLAGKISPQGGGRDSYLSKIMAL